MCDLMVMFIYGITFFILCEVEGVLGRRKKCFVLSFKVCQKFLDDLSEFMVRYGFENRSELLRRAVREFIESEKG